MPSSWYKDFMAGHGVEVGGHKPSPTKYSGPPMTLDNMRGNGVRSLQAACLDCYHQACINVDGQPGDLSVPSFKDRLVCSHCRSKRIDVRPAWWTKIGSAVTSFCDDAQNDQASLPVTSFEPP